MKTPLLLLATSLAIAAPPEPKFTAQDIDKTVKIGYGVAIADVDGDKLADILLADARQIRWYKNPGKRGAEWPRHVIAEELTKNDNVCIAAQDIDGDGKCEVAIGAEWNPGDTEKSGAVFYLIPPADRTQKWEPVKFPSVEPTTHRMRWVRLGEKEWGLVVLPLHGRGNKNGEGAGVKVLLYRKPADVKAEWKSEIISDSMHATHNFDPIAGPHERFENHFHLLLAGKEGVRLVDLEKPNAKRFRDVFPGTAKIEGYAGVGEVRMSKGWIAAIEPMHGNRLVTYRGADPAPDRRVLTDKLNQGHALGCGDLLGVGSDQIVVGWRGAKPGDKVGIAVWTALDDKGEKWRETLVDDNGTACEDLALADLDGDGKLDIIAAGRATHNLRILWNER
jgi:FG-GAP-like repeat